MSCHFIVLLYPHSRTPMDFTREATATYVDFTPFGAKIVNR